MKFRNYALLMVCLCLGFMSFQAWNAYFSIDRNTIYASASLKEKRTLDLKVQEMRERLSYMMFAKERKQSQVALIQALQQQLNLNPWSGSLWRNYFLPLTEFEASAKDPNGAKVLEGELDWVFSVVTKMQKWNRQERFLLINRCVMQNQRTTQKWMSLCGELLNKIWSEPNGRLLLRNLQVGKQELDQALETYGVIRPPWMLP